MAAAVYTTDLSTVNILDSTTPAVGEPTGSTAGTTIAVETDHYVVGTSCIAKVVNATGVTGLGFQNATAVTVPADGAVYMWTTYLAANAIGTQASGGMQLLVGNTSANYKRFYIYGSDTEPYGGWQVNAVNPANTASATQGTPNGTWRYFGIASNSVAAVQRGYPQGWDAVRSGRGSIIITGGDLANGYATFDAAAIIDGTNTTTGPVYNRWGILSFNRGTYTLQGRLALGEAGTAVDFRDSNRAIFIKNTEFVTAAFNQIEILNAASRVDWTGISISALGTLSKGRVIVTDDADVNIEACTFTDMSTFVFQSNSSVTNSTFRRCELITHGNSIFTGNLIDDSPAAIALTTSDPGLIQNCTFISSGTGHAMEITSPGGTSISFDGLNFVNYGVAGSANAALKFTATTGTITINIVSGGTGITITKPVGLTVNIVNAKSFTITNIVDTSEVRIYQQSDLTELGGVESVGSSPTGLNNVVVAADPDNIGRFTVTYSYGYTVDLPVFVVVLNNNYQALRPPFTLKSINSSLQITQISDRQYSNPV